ncbi:hypothetical protein [Thomasclavelia cocleata]|jgi:hypothetical protein|uniref:Uncharacterized protein n=1 Tax=Thomasclavelia cocleata TaxID=69824 RepID=A0A1I0G9W9_9FIRM|nr:hypothetical protein [Thomasclavelia cocleata]MCR1960934.1 hypothetical protein [Thomasclavelia cocleata]SET67491.1 hypothetical protein SAMN04489758_12724 [Thomasclavelia cocleata]
MNKYQVEVTETLQYREIIEAENEQKAIRKMILCQHILKETQIILL